MESKMATPLNYTEIVHDIDERLARIERMVTAIYNDELPPGASNVTEIQDEEISMEDRIKKYGQRIPYNLIEDPIEIIKFREFLYEAKKRGNTLKQLEKDMIDIADKNFDDIRLSSKHLNILKAVHEKVMGRPWPYKYINGYMFKMEGYAPEWVWFKDGREVSA